VSDINEFMNFRFFALLRMTAT